jgi:hypothetical protein
MKRLIFTVIISSISVLLFGQNDTISSYVVASAGGDTTVNGVSVSWTLGEVAIETIATNDSSIILTQGFQQGYFEITSIGEPLSDDFELKIYPNPASEYIYIDLTSKNIKSMLVEIYNMEGKLVYNKKYESLSGPSQISLNGLNSNQYILRVSESSGKVLQTFKLIKR